MQIASTKHSSVNTIESVFFHDLCFSHSTLIDLLFNISFVYGTQKMKRAQKVINCFDRFNYKFAKWNRKWFIRQSRCRMFVIRPSPKWWWWWWILSDAHSFLLSSCHFLRNAYYQRSISFQKIVKNNANYNEQCFTSIRGIFSFMVIF